MLKAIGFFPVGLLVAVLIIIRLPSAITLSASYSVKNHCADCKVLERNQNNSVTA